MSAPAPQPHSSLAGGQPAKRLNSWKEIASYLDVSVRTVQRWERTVGVPIHRRAGEKRNAVYAYTSEIDGWWQGRRAFHETVEAFPPTNGANGRARRLPGRIWIVGFLAALAGGLAVWLLAPAPALTGKSAEAMVALPLTTDRGTERHAALSSDGRQVAYSWNGESLDNYDIYLKLVGAGYPLRLTTHPAEEANPVWSPDGLHIAYLRRLSEYTSEVIIVPALGGQERRIVEVYGVSRDIPLMAWSPDGEWLVVSDSVTSHNPTELYLVSVSTAERRRLTSVSPAASGDMAPAFSSDGRGLAFTRISSWGRSDIYFLNLTKDLRPQGEPQRLITPNRWNASPAWTPNDGELIFSSGTRVNANLWRVSVSGSAPPRRVAFVGEDGWNPTTARFAVPGSGERWRAAYTRRYAVSNIWRLEIGGLSAPGGKPSARPAGREQILIHSSQSDWLPRYSPDGRRIAFVSLRGGDQEIWSAGGDGSDPKPLTSFGGSHLGAPRWSPDSEQIVFDALAGEYSNIYIMDAAGGPVRLLVDSPTTDQLPSWSKDGKWIYFTSNRSGRPQMWKMPAEGGQAVQITSDGGFGGFESADGKEFYYYRFKPNLSLWKVPSHGGAEHKVLDGVSAPSDFEVTAGGIYFQMLGGADGNFSIAYYDFSTAETTTLLTSSTKLWHGLTVSPDGSHLLYSRLDQEGQDLMLVENFN